MIWRLTSSSLAGTVAEAGGRGHPEAGLHVGDDPGADALDGLGNVTVAVDPGGPDAPAAGAGVGEAGAVAGRWIG